MRLLFVVCIAAVLGIVEAIAAKEAVIGESLLHYISLRSIQTARRRTMPARYVELRHRAPVPQDEPEPEDDESNSESDSDSENETDEVEDDAESSSTDSNSPFDKKQFNISAGKECPAAMEPMQSVVNPSGLAACYNIPFFDDSTGTFVVDLRLFQVSQPVGQFAGIPPSEYMMQIMIPQATLSDPQKLEGDDTRSNDTSGTGPATMFQGFQNVGQLNSQLQIDKLSLDDLRTLLIPNITLSAASNNSASPSTTLSSDTLSYLTGLFTRASSPDSLFTPTFPTNASSSASAEATDPRAINITLPDATARLPSILRTATPFSMPGTTLGVFPLGMILTGIWTGVFCVVVGWGTVSRWRFRGHYRRRRAMAAARGM